MSSVVRLHEFFMVLHSFTGYALRYAIVHCKLCIFIQNVIIFFHQIFVSPVETKKKMPKKKIGSSQNIVRTANTLHIHYHTTPVQTDKTCKLDFNLDKWTGSWRSANMQFTFKMLVQTMEKKKHRTAFSTHSKAKRREIKKCA